VTDPTTATDPQPGVSPQRRPLAVTAVAFVVMLGADLLVGAARPGFWPVFGFLSCTVLILASKALGKRLLLRDPGYYEPSGAGHVDADEHHEQDHGGGRG
jgi:hypothetical protein